MSEPAAPQPAPEPAPFVRFREAMKHILTVSKPEILRREEEYRQRRRQDRQKNDDKVAES